MLHGLLLSRQSPVTKKGYLRKLVLLMQICSYIPFTSPMAMFTRIAMSTVPWYEIAISIGILVASTFGIGILSAKIYRVGVLMYLRDIAIWNCAAGPPFAPSLLKTSVQSEPNTIPLLENSEISFGSGFSFMT